MTNQIHSKFAKRGVAAIIVTIAFSLLFVSIVVGLTALSIREQRQAGDIDQSNRALASAEAGIKDALSRLATNNGYRENICTSHNIGGADIVCRTVTVSNGPVITTQNKDEGRMAWIHTGTDSSGSPSGVSKVNINWAKSDEADDVASGYDWSGLGVTTLYPTFPPTWGGPAALEVTVVYWLRRGVGSPPTSPNTLMSVDSTWLNSVGNVLPSKTFLLWPSGGDHSPVRGHGELTATCSATPTFSAGKYHCGTGEVDLGAALEIPNPMDYGMVFKFRPRYRGTHVRADFSNGTSTVNIQDTAIRIDVTAKSGNIYKRLVAEKALESSARDNIFDSAVYSGSTDGICKNMKIRNDYSVVDANNCP